jgi:hypothetical protein
VILALHARLCVAIKFSRLLWIFFELYVAVSLEENVHPSFQTLFNRFEQFSRPEVLARKIINTLQHGEDETWQTWKHVTLFALLKHKAVDSAADSPAHSG